MAINQLQNIKFHDLTEIQQHSVIPKVGYGEGRMNADLIATS